MHPTSRCAGHGSGLVLFCPTIGIGVGLCGEATSKGQVFPGRCIAAKSSDPASASGVRAASSDSHLVADRELPRLDWSHGFPISVPCDAARSAATSTHLPPPSPREKRRIECRAGAAGLGASGNVADARRRLPGQKAVEPCHDPVPRFLLRMAVGSGSPLPQPWVVLRPSHLLTCKEAQGAPWVCPGVRTRETAQASPWRGGQDGWSTQPQYLCPPQAPSKTCVAPVSPTSRLSTSHAVRPPGNREGLGVRHRRDRLGMPS